MISAGKQLVALASLPFAAVVGLPAASYAAEIAAPGVSPAAGADSDQSVIASPTLYSAASELSALIADAAVTWGADTPTGVDTALAAGQIDPELECMAKVVMHEAGNQSRRGQLAVAQLIMNRIDSGRFADTICGVANQPGQFFRTAAYNPNRDSAQWHAAVDVSREARDGSSADVVPGALFYHAAYASAGNFFRSRQRVTTLGDHIFYR